MTSKVLVVAFGGYATDPVVIARLNSLGVAWAHPTGDVWLISDPTHLTVIRWREEFSSLGFSNVIVSMVAEGWTARLLNPSFMNWVLQQWNGRYL